MNVQDQRMDEKGHLELKRHICKFHQRPAIDRLKEMYVQHKRCHPSHSYSKSHRLFPSSLPSWLGSKISAGCGFLRFLSSFPEPPKAYTLPVCSNAIWAGRYL